MSELRFKVSDGEFELGRFRSQRKAAEYLDELVIHDPHAIPGREAGFSVFKLGIDGWERIES